MRGVACFKGLGFALQCLAVTIKASAHSLKVDLQLRRGGDLQAGAAPGGEGVDLCRGEVREGGRGGGEGFV